MKDDNIILISPSLNFLVDTLSGYYSGYSVHPSFGEVESVAGKWCSFNEQKEAELQNTAFTELIRSNGKQKRNILYDAIADFLIRYYAIVSVNHTIWIFSGQYKENKGDVEKVIDRILRKENITRVKDISKIVSEVKIRITIRTALSENPFNSMKNAIPLKNGVLLLPEKVIVPNAPTFGFTYCINADYNPDVDTSKMEKYLESLVKAEDVALLKQIGACCLVREAYKKAYFIFNRVGNNGKTTFLNILTEFLGQNNVSANSLQDITTKMFRAAEMDGKIANIYPELPLAEINDISTFKAITGDDYLMAERKYQHPYKFQCKAIQIFGANTLPSIHDLSPAVAKRLVLLEFPNVFSIEPNFINEMTTEEQKSALLNIFLDYLVKEVMVKGVRQTENKYEVIAETYKKESDSVYRFYLQYLELGEHFELSFDVVYGQYIDMMKAEGSKAVSKRKFTANLEREGINRVYKGPRGEQEAYLEGVRFKVEIFTGSAGKGEAWV